MADATPAPPPGTIAYAEWKRKQEQAQKPANQETGKLGRKEVAKEVSREASFEVKKPASREAGQEAPRGAVQAVERPVEEKPVFKASFLYTEEEIELFEDLKLDMRRKHGLRITKNDLARASIQLLAEDYRKNAENSYVIKTSRSKPAR